MGYFVAALASIGEDDRHSLFLTFIPGRLMQHQWINDWVYEKFGQIAEKMGPEGAIVAPVSPSRGFRDLRLIDEDFDLYGAVDSRGLNSGRPLMVVTKTPFRHPSRAGRLRDSAGLLVDLTGMRHASDLAELIDLLSALAKRQDSDSEDLMFSLPEHMQPRPSVDMAQDGRQRSRWAEVVEAVEIKPGIFGVSVNLVEFARRIKALRKKASGVHEITF